jgi:hypothetical protein
MFMALTLALAAVGQPAAPQEQEEEPRYSAYWLAEPKGSKEYRVLLIARLPLREMVKVVNLFEKSDVPLLERLGLTITTYKKDEIHNTDRRPIKPLTRFGFLNEKERSVEVNGIRYHYEECPLEDVVRLLKNHKGNENIARINSPLAGMEQTARALRLLLEEQMKEDAKKK